MNADVIEIIHATALVAFFALLFVGATSTVGRMVMYRVHGFRRPRLLARDAAMLIGFALSFGLILLARAIDLPPTLRDNVLWALMTDVPAIVAVGVYVYFEFWVIERGRDDARDYPLREPTRPDVPLRGDHPEA